MGGKEEAAQVLAAKFAVIFPHLDERQRRLLMAAVQEAAISQSDIDGTRTQVVEALTRFGSQLNELLVLPINKPLEAQVFVVEEAVDLFRGSFMNPAQSLQYRKAVSPTILKLFSLLREGNLVRIANNTRRISDQETIEDVQIHGPE